MGPEFLFTCVLGRRAAVVTALVRRAIGDWLRPFLPWCASSDLQDSLGGSALSSPR